MKRIGAWLCCGCCAAFGLAAVPGAAQPAKAGKAVKAEQFTESTEVLVVEVPVQVLRNGEPVRGLTANDFELWEGREKQTITGFEVLDLAAAGPAASPQARKAVVPPSARRRFLLLFDLSSADQVSIGKAREAARSLVADGLHPTDLVGVASFEAARGAELILGFTSDRQQLEVALDRLGEKQKAADPLRLVLTQSDLELAREAIASVDGDSGGGRGPQRRSGDEADQAGAGSGPGWADMMRLHAERTAQAAQENSMADFSASVTELARTLAAIEGRKHVVFLSEGFDSGYLLGTQDQAEIDRMSEASQGGEYWRIDSDTRYGSTKMIAQVESMLEELRRADCVIQAVDIAGLRAPGEMGSRAASALRQDGLFVLADSTGGELYSNFNDLSEAMDSMLKRHSVTYVLSYQPEQIRRDGSFRKLRVELRSSDKAVRGARIVHRPGYYAPKPFAEQAAIEKTLDTASQVTGGREGGSIPVDVLAAPFARPGGKAYVPVLIEAEGTGLLSGQKDEGVLPAEVYVYAFDGDGKVQDFFARSLGLDLGKVGPALRHSGLKMFGDLDLPAGSYSLRVLVRNGATGATSLKVASLEVPAFSDAAPVLLPPFFPEPQDRWLLVRENAAPPQDVAYPFMDGQGPFIPAAHPDLRPGEEARLSLVGWHLQPGDLRADARILTAEGTEAGTGEIRVLGRQTEGAGKPDRIAAGFRPPRLAPGEYHLLVTLTDPTGASQTSTAEFTVPVGGGGG